jgi:hypothetical protein
MIFDWNEHYKTGGQSGDPEEYIKSRCWKHDVIERYCNLSTDTIIDIGCGDLQFWNHKLPNNYLGVDISPVIIKRNSEMHSQAKFIVSSASDKLNISADVVICFDMLWHIIDDIDYIKILQNIKSYSNKYIIIYTWNKNVFDKGPFYRLFATAVRYKQTKVLDFSQTDNDGGYQKYRDFLNIATPIFSPDFDLVNKHTNPNCDVGTMYIFKKS